MRSLFIGRMTNGEWRAAVAKPGFDAGDPSTLLANMNWSSQVGTTRKVASGQTLVDGYSDPPNTGDGLGSPSDVTIPQVVGAPYLTCLVQAETRWSYLYFNVPLNSYQAFELSGMQAGWWAHPQSSPWVNLTWLGPHVTLSLLNSTTLRIRTNNNGNGTNNKVRVRWAVFETR